MGNLLLLSNSTMPGTSFFTWPRPWVSQFLGEKPKNLIFIPFAAVTLPYDEYEDVVKKVFNEMKYSIFSIHRVSNKWKAIEDADAIVVGGGNSFALLANVYREGILELIQEKVSSGTPYIGWSAGANLACPTIKTTNDMPIVYPPSLDALDLVPFQINPHYHELRFENQGGETRRERLLEFQELNQELDVLGLPEGMLVQKNDDSLTLHGDGVAKFYRYSKATMELSGGSDLSILLRKKSV
jgi:dipeptidase E